MEEQGWTFYIPRRAPEVLADEHNNITDSFNPYFQLHNKFANQSHYNNIARQYVEQKGAQAIYYVTTLKTTKKPVYVGNQVQDIIRVFHTKVCGDTVVQPELMKLSRFGALSLDETSVIVHKDMFFIHNMRNLKENGIAPELDPNKHNPWISQRGYADFNYHGYSAQQIFPKAGDLIKPEWIEELYVITDVNEKIPELSFSLRSYYFKFGLKGYKDDHKEVATDVRSDSMNTNDYVQQKFDQTNTLEVGSVVNNGPVIPTDNTDLFFKKLDNKDDVLFRPEEVPPEAKNITNHPKYGKKPFAQW